MERLFGLPVDQLTIALVGVFLLGVAVIAVIAARNRVVFKMAVRNIPRRRAQSTLIVVGLMLATLLFSASFATGDTLAHSIRVEVLSFTGHVDEVVRSDLRDDAGRRAFFDASVYDDIVGALTDAPVDGVMPVITWAVPAVLPPGEGGARSASFAEHIRAIMDRHGVRADGPDGILLNDETIHALDQSLETAIRQALDWALSRYGTSSSSSGGGGAGGGASVSVLDRFSKSCHDSMWSGHTMTTGLCAIFLCLGVYRRLRVSAQSIPRRCTAVLLCLVAGSILVVEIFLLLVNFEHYTLDILLSLLLISLTMTSRRALRFVYNCNFVCAKCWRFDDVFPEKALGVVGEGVVLREGAN